MSGSEQPSSLTDNRQRFSQTMSPSNIDRPRRTLSPKTSAKPIVEFPGAESAAVAKTMRPHGGVAHSDGAVQSHAFKFPFPSAAGGSPKGMDAHRNSKSGQHSLAARPTSASDRGPGGGRGAEASQLFLQSQMQGANRVEDHTTTVITKDFLFQNKKNILRI